MWARSWECNEKTESRKSHVRRRRGCPSLFYVTVKPPSTTAHMTAATLFCNSSHEDGVVLQKPAGRGKRLTHILRDDRERESERDREIIASSNNPEKILTYQRCIWEADNLIKNSKFCSSDIMCNVIFSPLFDGLKLHLLFLCLWVSYFLY